MKVLKHGRRPGHLRGCCPACDCEVDCLRREAQQLTTQQVEVASCSVSASPYLSPYLYVVCPDCHYQPLFVFPRAT